MDYSRLREFPDLLWTLVRPADWIGWAAGPGRAPLGPGAPAPGARRTARAATLPAMPATTKKKSSKKKRSKLSAKTADRHELYQLAVQCVEAEIDFVDATYKTLRGGHATRLREDFCGTANTSCEWVRRRKTNTAVGIDIDPDPLGWGTEHNLSTLAEGQRDRIELIEGDVLDPPRVGPFDVILAMNFSYWCLKQRKALLKYFQQVRSSLAENGVFFMDFYGGPSALEELEEKKHNDAGFTYIWEQAAYNPITGDVICHIHFRFPDGSKMRKAFTYSWRVFTIPELRDILDEAGFSRTTVYWEGDDPDSDEGNGEFEPTETGEACEAYLAYIVAER